MKIHAVAQGSVEWMQLRAGIVTASELDNLITPKTLEPRKGDMVASYLACKLAERWLGGPLPTFNTQDMDAGQILEQQAIPFLAFEYGWNIRRAGFIHKDDESCGCSPDGLLDVQDSGLEIKCPAPQTHARYLMQGICPPEYIAQVHGGMFVTGLPRWTFVSYRRRFPPLIVTVERDEKIMATIGDAVEAFNDKLDAAYQSFCELNGGPPRQDAPSTLWKEPALACDADERPDVPH